MEEKNKKKQIIKISVFITSLFVIFLSVTYAFINQTLTGEKRQVITAGNLSLELQEDENNLTIENAMPMYDEVGMIQDAFTFRLINKTSQDTNYILKLESIVVENPLDPSIVKYGLTKDEEVKIDFVSNIVDNTVDTGTIKGNQTIEYSLRLWVDANVESLENIHQKRLSYRLNIEASQSSAVSQVNSIVFDTISENLSDSCKTYNDGVDTFLVGQCQNNYVWYSGKLWRVVLKNNETGAVKMVTDNAITTIPYNERGNFNFENSYVDQWLQQEFLPTLHDAQDYLVTDSMWDATIGSTSDPTRPDGTTLVNRTVGLLNAYEYYMTYHNSDELVTPSTGYLYNGIYWWLLTPGTSNFMFVNTDGSLEIDNFLNGKGIRPSINLKSNIQIVSGAGGISDPYRLVGDEQETVAGTSLLSTRYSGEYLRFNNELYRIVDVEHNLTKITAVDKPSQLKYTQFHSTVGNSSFADVKIKTDLENYYLNNISEPYKAMIEPNTTWYIGIMGTDNYKTSICKTVNIDTSSKDCEKTDAIAIANIALPRIGEMFTSQITKGVKTDFWTLTPSSTSYVLPITNNNFSTSSSPGLTYGARPSMYLKSSIKIASDNTGNGTYEKPYTIE